MPEMLGAVHVGVVLPLDDPPLEDPPLLDPPLEEPPLDEPPLEEPPLDDDVVSFSSGGVSVGSVVEAGFDGLGVVVDSMEQATRAETAANVNANE